MPAKRRREPAASQAAPSKRGRRSKGASKAPRKQSPEAPGRVVSAARRIQRGYRAFRAKFPAGGRLHSRSSSEVVEYQEQKEYADALAAGFCKALVRAANTDPATRAPQLRRQMEADKARGLLPKRLGDVRAVLCRDAEEEGEGGVAVLQCGGVLAFSGTSAIHRWAVRGYEMAVEQLGEEGGERLVAMEPWEVDYVVRRFQRDEAPAIVASELGVPREKVRLIRTAARQRSLKPAPGHESVEYVVPLLQLPGVKVVGAPGDGFRLRRDLARFLGHALGGFERYRWELNPLRRRRVHNMPRRYILRANTGLGMYSAYRILRSMHAWAGRMDPSRNWQALFPRLLPFSSTPRSSARMLRFACHALARRLLREAGAERKGRSEQPASLGSRYMSWMSRSSTSRSGSGSREPDGASSVAGYYVDDKHAGFFHASLSVRPSRPLKPQLTVTLMDPLGRMTFAAGLIDRLRKALSEAFANVAGWGMQVQVRVAFGGVPERLALQYQYEGSCGPSSIALIMSLLRHMRRHPEASYAGIGGAEGRERIFRGVIDEDVVAAVQMLHGSVV
jgi:hypothetical protein